MKKILGITLLLVVVCLATGAANPVFFSSINLENLTRRSALFAILSIGAAFVIITGGIDLSIGSVVCLTGCLLPWLLVEHRWPVALALPAVLALAGLLGLVHGLLVTKLRLQPFVVTLCGLLIYRGTARGLLDDQSQGFGSTHAGLRRLAIDSVDVLGFGVPVPFLILLALALLAAYVLNGTVYGRYLLALGRNEQATRYCGIDTDRMVVGAYVACASLAGIGGVLFVLDVNTAGPSEFGNFYELYAIAGAVLGGCALRGGEGSILGVVIGASLMHVLRNSIRLIDAIPDQLQFAVIGVVILAGVVADELVKRVGTRRRT
ncbi:MAG: ABC transporter permease [Planctomycetes bacterium]|nr:ABC transporter permease [Planctomycetota bacterium]